MTSPSGNNTQLVYQSVNKKMLESVPGYVRNILDIGCGGGGARGGAENENKL
jgi:2-polyprenyl-3-methyl-5-hydroxy-6-metoxy-1,4-benzoquinol methylase